MFMLRVDTQFTLSTDAAARGCPTQPLVVVSECYLPTACS